MTSFSEVCKSIPHGNLPCDLGLIHGGRIGEAPELNKEVENHQREDKSAKNDSAKCGRGISGIPNAGKIQEIFFVRDLHVQ